jgi:ubiquinone/menaquinone biosynthesis C-methylase UbiE
MATIDRYITYTHRYFRFWLPVYDWFAASIGYVYRAGVARARIAEGERVVDICTGTGAMALRLASAGARVTGVDVTLEMLRSAAGKGSGRRPELALMDARRLAFADSTFDTAVLSLALHDMPRAVSVEVLREAARVSRRRIFVLDYDLPSQPILHRASVAAIRWFETVYFPRYVKEGLEPLLRDAGLHKSVRTPIPLSFFALCEITL